MTAAEELSLAALELDDQVSLPRSRQNSLRRSAGPKIPPKPKALQSVEEETAVGPILPETKPSHVAGDRFLIHGGVYRDSQMEIFHPTSDEPSVVQSFQEERWGHTATRLPDGSILVAGGYDKESISSCELLDPLSLVAAPTAPLPSPRLHHAAAFLNGRVYICGGDYGDELRSVVRYVDGVWEDAAPMITARTHFALASNTQAIYAFGGSSGSGETAACERFDEGRGKWKKIKPMLGGPRWGLRAVYGDDGRFWICGGWQDGLLTRTEMYDPKSGKWMSGTDMNEKRSQHGLVKTSDGRIWALGGYGGDDRKGVEVLDPRQPVWQKWEKELQLDCYESAVVRL